MAEDQKPWRCKNGHILGSVRRNGHKITELRLFRNAIDLSREKPEELDVIAVIIGRVIDVRCNVEGCGTLRVWIPGEESMAHLMESRKRMMEGK